MAMSDFSQVKKPTLQGSEYEGHVISNKDPDKRQRVQIRIPILHRGIPDDKLPWSNTKAGGGTSNAGSGVGSVQVPDNFAKVRINFVDDDPHNPQYSTSPTSDDVNKDNELLQEDYPSTQGNADSFGNRWSVNRATGDVNFTHKTGTSIHVDGAGNVSIGSPTSVVIGAASDISVIAGGVLKLHGAGGVDIAGPRIDLNTNAADSPTVGGARPQPQITSQAGKTNA